MDYRHTQTKTWSKLPGSKVRYGPGFSKLLPKLDTSHKKSYSEIPTK